MVRDDGDGHRACCSTDPAPPVQRPLSEANPLSMSTSPTKLDTSDTLGQAEQSDSPMANHRCFFLVFGATVSFLSTGLLFGWPALVPLLRRDGQYCEQCSDPCSESKSCTEQSVQFNLIFTVSQAVFTCGTVVAGLMLDKCGPRITCTAGLLAVASGCAIVAVSESDSLNLFLPGFICLSLGAPAIHLSCFHISNLYPEKKASVHTTDP